MARVVDLPGYVSHTDAVTASATRRTRERRTGPGVLGALALAADTADELLLGTVRDVHGAVADRVYGLTGGPTRGVAQIHDQLSSAVYAGIGAGLRATSRGLREADRRGCGARIDESRRGRLVVSAVNGLMGDRLTEQQSELAISLAVRHRSRDVEATPEALAAAFPEATPDLVVFLHGLGEHDGHWNRRAAENGGSYGSRLAEESSWTPVYLRANTGLPIAENGVALASLLDRLVAAWPTEVRRIALVGHSMGGLIMRAACAVVTDAGHALERAGDQRGHPRHPPPRGAPRTGRRTGGPGPRRAAGVGAVRPDPRVPIGRHPRPASPVSPPTCRTSRTPATT